MNIAVYVSHTNIDVVNDGLNDWFCDLLDIKDTTYLTQTSENHGIGRVGDIMPQTIEELALKVKSVFGLDSVRWYVIIMTILLLIVWLFVVVAVKDFIRML